MRTPSIRSRGFCINMMQESPLSVYHTYTKSTLGVVVPVAVFDQNFEEGRNSRARNPLGAVSPSSLLRDMQGRRVARHHIWASPGQESGGLNVLVWRV